jgi:hypothetical protein
MPIDISSLSIKANLKGNKHAGKESKKEYRAIMEASETKQEKKTLMLLGSLVPLVRNDIFDRLNR